MVLSFSGWCPDLPSHKDFTISQRPIRRLLSKIPLSDLSASLPAQVDSREFCHRVVSHYPYPTGCACACTSMVQYFEKRASGRSLAPSRMFVHQVACRLSNATNSERISLRTTLKAMIRFGLPPERYWPYNEQQWEQIPDAFLFGFGEHLAACHYVRLDGHGDAPSKTLQRVKGFLASGFGIVFGLMIPNEISGDADIHFPSPYESCGEGQAVLCVGYDDRRRIRSEKGAFLIQNSWGDSWGDRGFGWIPYRYLTESLAVDFWTLMKGKWLKSDEFLRPR